MKEGFWATKTDPKDRVNLMPWEERFPWPLQRDHPVDDDVLEAAGRC